MKISDESLKRMLSVRGKLRFSVSKNNKSKLDNKNWHDSKSRLDSKKF